MIDDLSALASSAEVVATVKLDGEQCTMYRDHIHARSVRGASTPSQSYVRALHGRIAHEIPEGWRICGENLYAKHAIHYRHLDGYFYVHSIWDELTCLDFATTLEVAMMLDLPVAPVLYRGRWDEPTLRGLYRPEHGGDPCEGYVVRTAGAFRLGEYRRLVGKYVRPGHIAAHGGGVVVRNELRR